MRKPHFARLSYKFCSQHCLIVLIYGLDKEIVRDTGRRSDCTEWSRTALTNNATTYKRVHDNLTSEPTSDENVNSRFPFVEDTRGGSSAVGRAIRQRPVDGFHSSSNVYRSNRYLPNAHYVGHDPAPENYHQITMFAFHISLRRSRLENNFIKQSVSHAACFKRA